MSKETECENCGHRMRLHKTRTEVLEGRGTSMKACKNIWCDCRNYRSE